MPDLVDIWNIRLVDTTGKVRARWYAPRDLRERLPYKFETSVKSEWWVYRIEFLDADERVVFTWSPPMHAPSIVVRPGDTYVFTLKSLPDVLG